MNRLRLILKLIHAILEVIDDELERKKRSEQMEDMEDGNKYIRSNFRNSDKIY